MQRSRLNSQSAARKLRLNRNEVRFHSASGLFYLIRRIKDEAHIETTILDADGNALNPAVVTIHFLRDQTEKVDQQNPWSAAKPTMIDGKMFASRLEADRFIELQQLERAGQITNLRRQVRYKIELPSLKTGMPQKITTYIADYVYEERGKTVVEDPKGRVTELFKIKQRLMLAVFGIEVRVLTRKDIRSFR